MKLFILRHGQAEPQRTTDEARELTEKGRADTARVLELRLADMQGLGEIWASPLVRAQQTAGIAAERFPGLPIQTTPLLIPEASPTLLIDWLQSFDQPDRSILLVSHQPFVGELVNQLCGKPAGFYPMGTSSLASIHISPVVLGLGAMQWLDHA